MEKSRHRKSRSASGIMEGSKLGQKQVATPKVTLNSRSYCDETTRGDMVMHDLGKISSKRVTGTPIKNLLAEEMAKEGESKKRPTSIVARLMGLEGMPSPQHIGRQQRRFSDSCQHRNEQIDSRRRKQLFDEQSSKRSSMEHQEFKDVYEDLEASHVGNRRHSSRWNETEDLRLLIWHLYSRSLWMQSEPDSLFVKHLQDLQVESAILKPSNSVKYEVSAKSSKSVRGGSCKQSISLQKSALMVSYSSHTIAIVDIIPKSPHRNIASVPHHPDVRKHAQYHRASPGGAGEEEEKNSSKNMGISRPKDAYFRGSGVKGYAGDESSCDVYESDSTGDSDITTLSCRKSSGRGNLKKSSSLGSESSVGREAKKRLSERWKMTQYYQDIEMTEVTNEPGGRKGTTEWDFPLGISSRDGWKDVCINDSSGYRSTSPPFCSKKHRTRAHREVFLISNAQFPKSLSRSLDGMVNLRDEFLSKDSRSSKRNCIPIDLDLSEKRSLASQVASADGLSYTNASDDAETESITLSSEYSVEMHRKLPAKCGSASPINQEVSILQRLLVKFPHLTPIPLTLMLSENGHNDYLVNKRMSLLFVSMVFTMRWTVSLVASESSKLAPKGVGRLQGLIIRSLKYQGFEALPEPSPPSSAAASVVLEYPAPEPESSVSSKEADHRSPLSVLEYPAPEPESSVSSKEADHPSPPSVLEVPFTEDVSSGSECFERVSAELNGLSMQLKLLKMESEPYADVILSDDEVESFEDNCSLRSQSWQSSYIMDVLTDSGLKASDPDTFVTSFHTLECPLSPWIFDNLEKKYTDEITGRDMKGGYCLTIVRKYVDRCPWVKPIEGINWRWETYGMKNILHQLLRSHEDPANADTPGNVVEEMHWLALKDDMDVTVKDIEELLIEDLIEEVVGAI
ncbi:hypothetical protein H5410_044982 [Solanum commersonii]|uniref:DUF4378 domain-containing protein n=1 Tax=Solanum commersonii TaxID=4109 RepID=A0A9J5XBH1_SOLCO|nr:hypothetical protein H5410_044982 [Solanum commersonii]